jgi:hypothetical protein
MSENFGLVYASTFDGSMYGTSPVVFAVWMYVLAHGYGGQVDLNPKKLAATFGTTVPDVEAAIRLHCAPDPDSRSDADEGRRLRHLGGVRYEVVNHELYKNARALEEKRAYDRQKKRESRERQRAVDVPIFDLSKKTVTTADPLVLVSVSSPSGSDPEGVQGEPPPAAHEWLGEWVVPPELVEEADREHGIGREELEERVARLRLRKIPGGGVSDLTGYVRGLLPEWATWEPPKPKGVRKRRGPKAARPARPPWVSSNDVEFARQIGSTLVELASDFARGSPVPPERLAPDEARAAFLAYLEQRARDRSSAAA